MVALWNVGIDGETEFEQAIVYAAATVPSNPEHIIRLLLDGTYRLTMADRQHLANFLEGGFRRSVGRRPKTRQLPLEQAHRATPVQRAADRVRWEIDEARSRGESVYGMRRKLVQQFAAELGASPSAVMNNLNRTATKHPRETK